MLSRLKEKAPAWLCDGRTHLRIDADFDCLITRCKIPAVQIECELQEASLVRALVLDTVYNNTASLCEGGGSQQLTGPCGAADGPNCKKEEQGIIS